MSFEPPPGGASPPPVDLSESRQLTRPADTSECALWQWWLLAVLVVVTSVLIVVSMS